MALLSERLMEIAKMVTPGYKVADIGCDHAYLSIYLTKENISPKVIACDVNKGPVEIARNNIDQFELSEKISLRLSDGLKKIEPGEVDSIVIAGMGGNLIINILSEGRKVADMAKEIILEPQSDVGKVRHFLQDNGFRIISESMIKDEDKFYPIIKAIHGEMDLGEEIYFKYGKILIHEANPVLHEFLILQKKQVAKVLSQLDINSDSENAKRRIEELTVEVIDCERAIMEINERVSVDIEKVIK